MTMADAQILEHEVRFAGPACTINAFSAEPADGAPCPAVIVVQEWWGLNGHIRDIARRFAREGYVAVAPDLYSRQGHRVASDANTAAQLMGGLKMDEGIADLKASLGWIRAQKRTHASRIGITGYCMGGGYALLLACESSVLAATAPFYGEIPADDKIAKLGCPIFYAYDANDGWIQRKDVDRLAADLKKYGKKGAVKIYPDCSHGFFNDTRPDVYNAAAAKDAWAHTLALFAENLKG
jgi:carboxymethylenebutenolidase